MGAMTDAPVGEVSYTLRYSSSRAEVWRAYWRAWSKPAGLWRIHLAIGTGIAVGLIHFQDDPAHIQWMSVLAHTVLGTAACMVLFPLWPLIRFKSSERTLHVDPIGWRTTIGNKSGSRAWKDIQDVSERGGVVAITGKNGNALLIPARAFTTRAARDQFVVDVRRWHAAVRT